MLNKITKVSRYSTELTAGNTMKLAQILEASPNEVYIFDQITLTIEYANPLAIKNLGYSLETLQTMTILDLKTELKARQWQSLVNPLVKHDVTQINFETTYRRANGSVYPVEVYLQLVEADGKNYFCAIVVDITQNKNAEQSLQDRIRELAHVANNIPGAVYRLHYYEDGGIKVEYISDRVEEILEISTTDIYADFSNIFNLVHEADRSSFSLLLQDALTHLNSSFWEGRIVTPSQRLVWIQVSSDAEQQPDGSVIRYGVLLDVTARKEAELALQESEEKFRQFAENIDEIFWMIDPNLKQLFYVSPSYEDILGYPPDFVLQKPFSFLEKVHPDDRLAVEKVMNEPLTEKQDTEYRIIRSDGEIRWLRDRIFPVKNKNGEIERIAGITQDITEDKQVKVEINHHRELREVIFDEATDALFLVHPITFTIIDCNRRAVELLQADRKETLLSQKADYLYKTRFLEIQQLMAEVGFWKEEIMITALNGEEFWGDVVWKKINVTDTSIYLVRVTDISEQKSFEAELKATNECLELTNQELARATKLKDEFLASMSHEIRTPLNAILGMSEALQEAAFEPMSEPQKQAVKTIETSGKHLLALINDILDLAKIQSGTVTLNFDQVNIKSLCESSLTFIAQLASHKGVELDIQFQTLATSINIDELRLRQILINLLSNAVKFTNKGGKVTLTVAEDDYRQHIIFSVSDTGIGIPQEQIDQLFEPFVQLNTDLNRNHGGTGLGLSLVRRITEVLGGSITVDSEVGRGSTFTVKLPYTDVCFISNETMPSLSNPTLDRVYTTCTIVVANSDQPTLDSTCSYLEASSYEVISVNTVESLLATLFDFTPQLIVMDLDSFEMTPELIIQQIRAISGLETVPLLLLITETFSAEIQEKLAQWGASHYLVKPIRLRHLLNQIQKQLIEESQQ